jgi:hypothetical protein
MWVIVAYKSLQEQRDNRISELIGEYSNNKQYIGLRSGGKKYHTSSSFAHSKIFKTEGGANRIIEEFNSLNIDIKKHYQNKFSWIAEYVLLTHKLTIEEWNQVVDTELYILENRYQKAKNKLLKKKTLYK